jgi:hypothetical protein
MLYVKTQVGGRSHLVNILATGTLCPYVMDFDFFIRYRYLAADG